MTRSEHHLTIPIPVIPTYAAIQAPDHDESKQARSKGPYANLQVDQMECGKIEEVSQERKYGASYSSRNPCLESERKR